VGFSLARDLLPLSPGAPSILFRASPLSMNRLSWGRPDCGFYFFSIVMYVLLVVTIFFHPKLKVFLDSSVNEYLSRFFYLFFPVCCRCKFLTLPRGSLSVWGVCFPLTSKPWTRPRGPHKFCTPRETQKPNAWQDLLNAGLYPSSMAHFRKYDHVYFPWVCVAWQARFVFLLLCKSHVHFNRWT
jgi:hypothetical protein